MTAPANTEIRALLALLRTPRIGTRTLRALSGHFGSFAGVLAASRPALAEAGLNEETINGIKNPDWGAVDGDLGWLETEGRHCLDWKHPGYPAMLGEIPDPPPLLFVEGDAGVLTHPQIAIVGSRNPSPLGQKLASEFSLALVESGFAVTSGLALGIDAAAHRAALDAQGFTLAVAGTGLDQVYPRSHRALAEAIVAQGGAIVSEFPTRTPPQAANFPRRNRIISGLSLGVLVVEAALRSGSLITARMAVEQGREVFALPGAVNNPLARGCNALIKQGAKLVETVDDILEEFAPERLTGKPLPLQTDVAKEPKGECHALLKYIAYAPTSVDALVAATGVAPDAIAALLLDLELQGFVAYTDGGYSRLR